jgi:hypothetical protein
METERAMFAEQLRASSQKNIDSEQFFKVAVFHCY